MDDIIIRIAFAVSLLSCNPADAQPKPPTKPEFKISEMEQAVIDVTNEERNKAKLKPLEANPLLFDAIRKHAAEMAKHDKLENDFDNVTLADRIQIEKYRFTHIGSNIAMGQRTAKQVVDG